MKRLLDLGDILTVYLAAARVTLLPDPKEKGKREKPKSCTGGNGSAAGGVFFIQIVSYLTVV